MVNPFEKRVTKKDSAFTHEKEGSAMISESSVEASSRKMAEIISPLRIRKDSVDSSYNRANKQISTCKRMNSSGGVSDIVDPLNDNIITTVPEEK